MLVDKYCQQLRRRYSTCGLLWYGLLCQSGSQEPRRACREIEGSFQCAKHTAEIMRKLITKNSYPDAATLIAEVREVGTKMQAAKPVGEWPGHV